MPPTQDAAAKVVYSASDDVHLARYVHLGTGNYNPMTARSYTDLSFFTCRPDFGEDASALFNLLTGYSKGNDWNRLIVAPKHLSNRLTGLIERERVHAEEGRPARIIAKINSLVDPKVIEMLYRASQAGVRIDLIVRGICCLRPGMPGISDNIRVTSIVDKYLEHSRIAYFPNGDDPEGLPVLRRLDAPQLPPPRRDQVPHRVAAACADGLIDGILGVVVAEQHRGARAPCPTSTYLPRAAPGTRRPQTHPIAGRVPEHGDPGVRGPAPSATRPTRRGAPAGSLILAGDHPRTSSWRSRTLARHLAVASVD